MFSALGVSMWNNGDVQSLASVEQAFDHLFIHLILSGSCGAADDDEDWGGGASGATPVHVLRGYFPPNYQPSRDFNEFKALAMPNSLVLVLSSSSDADEKRKAITWCNDGFGKVSSWIPCMYKAKQQCVLEEISSVSWALLKCRKCFWQNQQ